MSTEDHHNHNENGFYKGLFYGVVVGLSLVWFLGTKEGRKLKDELLTKGEEFIDQAGQKVDKLTDEDDA
jgi:gas vesicle protein